MASVPAQKINLLWRITAARAQLRTTTGTGVIPRGFCFLGYYLGEFSSLAQHFTTEREQNLLTLAFQLSWNAHFGELRKEKRRDIAYIQHPLEVAQLAAKMGFSANLVAAALLHDVIENLRDTATPMTVQNLRAHFVERGFEQEGEDIAALVDGVTTLGKEPGSRTKKPTIVHIYQKWLSAGNQDLRVIILKLLDRYVNAPTFDNLLPDRAKIKAEETLNVYARVAKALGMWEVGRDLEDYSFRCLEREKYEAIFWRREELIVAGQDKIEKLRQEVLAKLRAGKVRGAQVIIETRHIYELCQRMKIWGIDIKDLSATDIFRINVVVPHRSDCYRSEGIIVGMYPSLEDSGRGVLFRRRDHIASPVNRHQFLHFYVQNVPDMPPILVQIRSRQMQEYYQQGVVVDIRRHEIGPERAADFLEALHEDLRKSRGVDLDQVGALFAAHCASIKVTGVSGEAVTLPFGSTALDFAAATDENIFLRAAGVRINNRPADLFAELHAGDQVEIITDQAARPALQWEKHLRTAPATRILRQYLHGCPESEIINLAAQALEVELRPVAISTANLFKSQLWAKYLARARFVKLKGEVAKLHRLLIDLRERTKQLVDPQPSAVLAAREILGPLKGKVLRLQREILNSKQRLLLLAIGWGEKRPDQVVAELRELYFRALSAEKEKLADLEGRIALADQAIADGESLGVELASQLVFDRRQLRQATAPFWLSIRTDLSPKLATQQVGLLSQLTNRLAQLRFSVADLFIVEAADRALFVLGVNVLGGRNGGGIAGQAQRLIIQSVGESIGETAVINSPRVIRRMLRQKGHTINFV